MLALTETAQAKTKDRPLTDRAPDWFRIENKGARSAEVFMYDEIGPWGTAAGPFASALAALDVDSIALRVNSPGGSVFDGVAIYNAIKRHPARVTGHVDGIAASAASFILMAADEIVVEDGARLMVHNAQGLCAGEADDMIEMAQILNELSDGIADLYAARAGGTRETWRAAMKRTSWYDASQAVEAGLADRAASKPKVTNTIQTPVPALAWNPAAFLRTVEEAVS